MRCREVCRVTRPVSVNTLLSIVFFSIGRWFVELRQVNVNAHVPRLHLRTITFRTDRKDDQGEKDNDEGGWRRIVKTVGTLQPNYESRERTKCYQPSKPVGRLKLKFHLLQLLVPNPLLHFFFREHHFLFASVCSAGCCATLSAGSSGRPSDWLVVPNHGKAATYERATEVLSPPCCSSRRVHWSSASHHKFATDNSA